MKTDLRAMVECLLTAHYSEIEIVEYLTGPIGVTEAEAVRAVRACAGTGDVLVALAGQNPSASRNGPGRPESSTVR